MKIVCDACQAKYSISDDKVQGKVFKIRCKKCSNIIVVRGGANAAEPAAVPQEKDTRVYDYGYDAGGDAGGGAGGDDAVWHLVINQDQVGPMTVAEVQQRFAAGECDGETFAWREGFADWLPLAQVDTFAALVAAGGTTSARDGGGGAAAIGAMFGSGDDGGGSTRNDDLFAAASTRGGGHHEDDGGGDLFGSKQPAAAASAASSGANSKLRGERNENSVLFSLNNLAQLASDKPAISTPSAQAGHATGAAGGEGSGLIDIRSMASAYMGGGASVGKPATSSAIGSIDDLPVFGGGGFSEPAVIVPTVGRSRDNRLLYLMIGAVSLLAVVAIVMVVMLMKGGKKESSTPVAVNETKADSDKDKDKAAADKPAENAAGSAAAADTNTAAKADSTPPAPDPAKQTTTAPTPAPAPATHHTTTPSSSSSSSSPSPSHSSPAVSHSAPAPKANDTPPPPPPKTAADSGGSCDDVSCMVSGYAGACCAKFKHGGGGGGGGGGGAAPKPSGGGGGDLPDSLDRGMISSAIANVKARVTSCGEKNSAKGKVKVHVKVGGDGHVSSVNVETTPDQALGACVQAAVQKATFAKTQSGGSFSYPFVF